MSPWMSLALCLSGMVASSAAFGKSLDEYDPRALAAARHINELPASLDEMKNELEALENHAFDVIKADRRDLDLDHLYLLKSSAFTNEPARFEILKKLHLYALLKVYDTNELEALDRFYATPEGNAVLSKRATLEAQTPLILKTMLPDVVTETKAQYQADLPPQERAKTPGAPKAGTQERRP